VGLASNASQCEIDDCTNWCRVSLICTRDEGNDGDLPYSADGALSGSGDDDTSVVTCDEGFVVSYCEVKTGSLGYGSDGAHVSTSGDTCTAVNAGGGSGVNAHATCTQNTMSSDGLPYYNYQQDTGTSASLECPSGYSPHLCTVHSPWKSNLRNNDNFNDVGLASNASQCEIDDCTNWCRVSLICTRDEGNDGDLPYSADGALSGSGDDDTSVVTCDEGFVVSYCEVKTGSLGYGSDGAHVSTSGDTCTAVNAGGGSGVNAHATCTQNTMSSDGLPYYNYQQDTGTSASLECPSGYSPHLCTVHSPWKSNLRNNDNFNDVGLASNASQCEIDDCTNWCRVSLICTRDEVKPDGETRLGAGIVSPTVDIIGDDGFTTGSTDIFYIEDDVKLGTLLYVNISSGSDNAWQLDWMLVETEGLPNIARYVYNTETLHLSTDSSDDDGKAVDLLQMEVQGTETYYLVVETANKTEAGSDSIHVKAIIHGTNDVYTGYLDNEDRDDFVVGENDVFIFPGMGLAGRLECLTLLCWGDDSWEFDWIVVFSIKSYTQPPRVFWNNDTVMTTNSEEGVNEYHVCRNDNQWGSEVELLELV
jgi:hypothetical protein